MSEIAGKLDQPEAWLSGGHRPKVADASVPAPVVNEDHLRFGVQLAKQRPYPRDQSRQYLFLVADRDYERVPRRRYVQVQCLFFINGVTAMEY
jgi:hypothetical protein